MLPAFEIRLTTYNEATINNSIKYSVEIEFLYNNNNNNNNINLFIPTGNKKVIH